MNYTINRKWTSYAFPLAMLLAINASNNPLSINPMREFYWFQVPISFLIICGLLMKLIRFRVFQYEDERIIVNDIWRGKQKIKISDINSIDLKSDPSCFVFNLIDKKSLKLRISDISKRDLELIQTLLSKSKSD